MILSYYWQILDSFPQDQESLAALVKIPVSQEQDIFGSESPGDTIQPISLQRPIFGFLFSYFIQQPKINQPELQLQPELTLYDEVVNLKIVRQIRCKNCIYQELLVNNSEVHDNLMILTAKIKYHGDKKPTLISSIEELVRQAGNRQINLYSATTYASIRKELIIESPVNIEHQWSKQGYLLVKLLRTEENNQQVEIIQVDVMNWLATGSEPVKKEIISKLMKDSFKMKGRQTYALAFKLKNSMKGVQMPLSVCYRYPPLNQTFKMVKYLRGQESQQ